MALALLCNNCQDPHNPIEVDDETVKDALATGRPMVVTHDVCPKDADENAPKRKFHLVVSIYEVGHDNCDQGHSHDDQCEETEELVAQFGETMEGKNFTTIVPNLATELNKQWEKVVEQAPVIDG